MHQPAHLYVLPTPEKDGLTLITSPPLSTYELSPLPFFDARPEGLRAGVQTLSRVAGEESPISRFVRTPDGESVGVIRERGGEIWKVQQRGSKLSRVRNWPAADLVVILDGGAPIQTLMGFPPDVQTQAIALLLMQKTPAC